jgi:hypothetical protein
MWLLNRLFDAGEQQAPRFAFQGTVNWMRGLAIVCSNEGFSSEELKIFYRGVSRRPGNLEADNLVFECLLMAMHNVSSLNELSKLERPYECIRSAVVAWYYSTYYGSKAMLGASTGANPQTHAKTGKLWQTEFVDRGLVQKPFNLSIQNLTPGNIKSEISKIRDGNSHDLNTQPIDLDMAWGAIYSYLNGTADYEKEKSEEQVRNSADFKTGGFTDFRKKDAKALRDTKLSSAIVNFLVQAFRYRGKANYRDAIYLSYGADYSETLRQFIEDLKVVSSAFVLMTAYYVSRRVEKDSWQKYSEDVMENARFELPFDLNEI